MTVGYPGAPEDVISEDPKSIRSVIRAIARVVNRTLQGKTNNHATVTLDTSTTTTTVTDERVTFQSKIYFDPMTANAATELYGATMYVLEANRQNGEFTITHANNAQSDRTFGYVVVG